MSDMSEPRITVYVVSHNYGDFLEEAVESVLRQTVDDWELLLIDDGSSDRTSEIINLYESDERVRTYRTDGIGLPSVCNLAMREARGEYLIRLDGDDVFDENSLLVLRNWLDRHQDQALVFPDYYYINEHGEVFAQERREKLYDRNHMLDLPANGACTMIRKAVLEELGGYREDLGAQDGFDLWSRVLDRYRCGNVNIPLFYYRRHGSNLTNRAHHIMNARQHIKRDAIRDKLDGFRPIIAVIPCRRHYDFHSDAWALDMNGRSLLHHDIEKCLHSPLFDKVVVASDNPDVQSNLHGYEDDRLLFLLRERKETLRSASLTPTLERIARQWDPDFKGICVISYPQAPFVQTSTLEEAVTTLVLNAVDCSMGVEEIKDRLFKREPHGLLPINPPRGLNTDFDSVYREANTALALRTTNIKRGTMLGNAVVHFTVSRRECLFIRSDETYHVAKVLSEQSDA